MQATGYDQLFTVMGKSKSIDAITRKLHNPWALSVEWLLPGAKLYIYSDIAFDIHYVNTQGNEISADEAPKAVKEKAATGMN